MTDCCKKKVTQYTVEVPQLAPVNKTSTITNNNNVTHNNNITNVTNVNNYSYKQITTNVKYIDTTVDPFPTSYTLLATDSTIVAYCNETGPVSFTFVLPDVPATVPVGKIYTLRVISDVAQPTPTQILVDSVVDARLYYHNSNPVNNIGPSFTPFGFPTYVNSVTVQSVTGGSHPRWVVIAVA